MDIGVIFRVRQLDSVILLCGLQVSNLQDIPFRCGNLYLRRCLCTS